MKAEQCFQRCTPSLISVGICPCVKQSLNERFVHFVLQEFAETCTDSDAVVNFSFFFHVKGFFLHLSRTYIPWHDQNSFSVIKTDKLFFNPAVAHSKQRLNSDFIPRFPYRGLLKGRTMSTYLLDGVASSPTLGCLSQQACAAWPHLPFIWASIECSRARPLRSQTTSWGWRELVHTSWEQSGACQGLLPCSSLNSPTELCLAMNTFRWTSISMPTLHHASYDSIKASPCLYFF